MAKDAPAPPVLRFGAFELDLRSGEVRKAGRLIKLQPQPFRVLALLASQAGQIVTRHEIQQQIWGNETFVDFEKGLNFCIKQIRAALGDDADTPRYIETLPRRGYRFIGRVEAATPKALQGNSLRALSLSSFKPNVPKTDSAQIDSVDIMGPSVRWRMLGRAFAGFTVVILVTIVAFMLLRPLPPPKVLRYTKLTNDGRGKTVSSPLIYASRPLVTDGPRLYFMENVPGGRILASVSVGGGETTVLPTPFESPSPADISLDGSDLLLLGYSAGTENEAPLAVLGLTAGRVRPMGDVQAHDAAWSQDGQEIAYASGNALCVARADGTGSRRLATVPGTAWWPRWSPGGAVLRFTVFDPKSGSTSLWEVAADGTNLHPLLSGWNNPPFECCGNWTPDGRYFVFQSARNGKTNIFCMREKTRLFQPSGRNPVQLTAGQIDTLAPVVSRDGKKIFVIGIIPRGELLRYDSSSAHFVPYLGGISAEGVDSSRDGQNVTYVAYPEGTLWQSKKDGSEQVQLTFPPLRAFLPRWSPDKKWIAFAGVSPGRPWAVYIVPPGGGHPQQMTRGQCKDGDAGWSPDSNRLVFGCLGGQGSPTTDIHLLDLKTQHISLVPGSEGLYAPRWSPDGQYLIALTNDSEKLMLFSFATQQWGELVKLPIGYPSWSRDGRYIYFDSFFRNKGTFYRVRVGDRELERVCSLEGVRRAWGSFGTWSGLGPDDSPLVLRDIGSQEIYSVDWAAP